MEHDYGAGAARFGPLSIGVVTWVLAVLVAAAWIATHPRWQQAVARVGDVLGVRRVWQWATVRLGAATASLRVRLGLEEIAGIALISALAVVTLMAIGFTSLLDDVLEGDGFALVDHPAASWLARHRDLWLTNVLGVVTNWGGPIGQTIWVVAVCAIAATRARSSLPVLLGLAGGGGIAVIVMIAKLVVGRQRPTPPFALIPTSGFSFPSGHATGAAAVGLLCAWILCRWVVRSWATQVTVWAVTAVAIGLIGFSRLYLGVHFVTDVLAGWLLGAAWAGSVVLAGSWWAATRQPA